MLTETVIFKKKKKKQFQTHENIESLFLLTLQKSDLCKVKNALAEESKPFTKCIFKSKGDIFPMYFNSDESQFLSRLKSVVYV